MVKSRLTSIVSQPIKIVVDVVVVNFIAVDPRRLPLKFGWTQISNSWDIYDIEFPVVGSGWVGDGWCKVIFMSNPTFVMLCWAGVVTKIVLHISMFYNTLII